MQDAGTNRWAHPSVILVATDLSDLDRLMQPGLGPTQRSFAYLSKVLAYRRGDLFEKRRRLIDAWEIHCQTASGIGGAVISLNRGKAPNHIHGYSHIGEVDSL